MKGYWQKPEATKEILTDDGWLKTGDIAYVDESGKFFVVDRKKVRDHAPSLRTKLKTLSSSGRLKPEYARLLTTI